MIFHLGPSDFITSSLPHFPVTELFSPGKCEIGGGGITGPISLITSLYQRNAGYTFSYSALLGRQHAHLECTTGHENTLAHASEHSAFSLFMSRKNKVFFAANNVNVPQFKRSIVLFIHPLTTTRLPLQ